MTPAEGSFSLFKFEFFAQVIYLFIYLRKNDVLHLLQHELEKEIDQVGRKIEEKKRALE